MYGLDNFLQGAILVFCVKCVYGRWRWVAASVAGRGAPPPAPVPRPLARPPRLIAAITETVDTGPRQLPTGWVVPRSPLQRTVAPESPNNIIDHLLRNEIFEMKS